MEKSKDRKKARHLKQPFSLHLAQKRLHGGLHSDLGTMPQPVCGSAGGWRQAPRQIRGLENVTSQESLQLISLKKKVLRRQHGNSHQTHKSMMWSREAKLTVHAHSGCPTQESPLPAREDWTTCDLARTRLIRHCRRLHGEALASPFPKGFKSRPDWRYNWSCAQAGVASLPCSPDLFPF